jgi:hypothetical protein
VFNAKSAYASQAMTHDSAGCVQIRNSASFSDVGPTYKFGAAPEGQEYFDYITDIFESHSDRRRQSQRPDEFIKSNVAFRPLTMAI